MTVVLVLGYIRRFGVFGASYSRLVIRKRRLQNTLRDGLCWPREMGRRSGPVVFHGHQLPNELVTLFESD